jgi:hypothetical protein
MTTKSKIAIIKNGKIVYDEEPTVTKPNETNARYEREFERKKYRKDTIQPNSVQYAKAFPDDFRKRYGDDAFRLAS